MTADVSLADDVLAHLQSAPFWDQLGCVLLDAAPGTVTVRLPARPEFGRSSNTGHGSIHGGAVTALIDMAARAALLTVLTTDERRTAIDLAAHYLAPARGDLDAVATVRRRGRRTAMIDVEVTAGGKLVALGRTVFAALTRT